MTLTWDLFMSRFLNFFFEYLSISTVLLFITQRYESEADSFWGHHIYNVCYMSYQMAIVVAFYTTRCFVVRKLPIIAGFQFLNLILLVFFCVKGARINSQSASPTCPS